MHSRLHSPLYSPLRISLHSPCTAEHTLRRALACGRWAFDEGALQPLLSLGAVDMLPHSNGTDAMAAAALSTQLVYAWMRLVCVGVLLGAVGGGGVVLFSMVDDHLKVRSPLAPPLISPDLP